MSGITKVSEKMKKKISFGDYKLSLEAPIIETEEGQKAARKIYTLTKEDARMLQEIFANKIQTPHPASMSEIMSEAIQLLYGKLLN